MKIVILGAGHVGGSLARILADEKHDVTLVDVNAKALYDHQTFADLRTVTGFPSYPDVLHQADAGNADMLLAITNDDEVNMVACQVAHTLFNIPTKIARIYSTSYFQDPQLLGHGGMPIDVVIRPEQLVSENICRLIKYPGSLQVVEFADGRLLMAATEVEAGGALVGKCLHDLEDNLPGIVMRVVAIYRGGRHLITPSGNTKIMDDDEIFFISAEESVRTITAAFHRQEKPYSRVFIAGGGRVGMYLAQSLMQDYQVKLIERDKGRTKVLSETLDKVVVLHGDATNEEIMTEENVDCFDVFCALTSDDEDNILSAMLAKHLGVRKTMSLISRPKYVDLIQHGSIDIAISPQQDAISALLRHVRKGDVTQAHSLRRGAAEAIEAVAHGDKNSSRVVGRTIGEMKLPVGAVVAAVVREDSVMMAQNSITICSDDHVILFVDNKSYIPDIEKLFQVEATFF